MRIAHRSLALLLIVAVTALSPVFGGEGGQAHGGAGHAHASPHGGVVTTIGSNHAEWVFDAKTGKVDLYILGEDESKAAPIEASDLTAQIKISGKDTFVGMKLIANALQGEKNGQASRFSGQAAELIGASGMEVAIQIPISSKKHRAKFEWKPGMAGHGEHGHNHAESGPATLTSTIVALTPLATNSSSAMILKLTDKAGKAVKYEDLEVVHTQRIHLLIVDASLTDYQHIHPEQTERVGEYKFDFTPAKTGTYKLFADLLPVATKKQEYSTTTFDVPGTAQAVDRTTNMESTVGELKFVLTFDRKELKAGEALAASVVVTGRDGQPFAQLEPVMGAFAHAVAFDEKRESTVHIHPLGREPEKSTERGGPKLDFHMKFDEPGFWKLYIQVQVNNKDVFAPFGLQFVESGKPRAVATRTLNNKICPITGKPVHSMQAGAHLVFKETRVDLCCNGCEKSFLDDAEALFKKASAGLKQ